ncbi:SemiSWEET transporter [Candidatus Wolfebacteria bacterium]|nr:SemiSWEET transporter [Candidatus Wolfebacteria bacterium]
MDLITVVGFLAATCTTAAFLPQVIKTIKTKQTKDISLLMYIVFVTGVAAWLAYGILINKTPIIIANAVTLLLASQILILKIKYR